MACSITNTSRAPVVLRFASGTIRHLGIGESVSDVHLAEVRGNGAITGLVERRVVALVEDEPESPSGSGSGKRGGSARRRAAGAKGDEPDETPS